MATELARGCGVWVRLFARSAGTTTMFLTASAIDVGLRPISEALAACLTVRHGYSWSKEMGDVRYDGIVLANAGPICRRARAGRQAGARDGADQQGYRAASTRAAAIPRLAGEPAQGLSVRE